MFKVLLVYQQSPDASWILGLPLSKNEFYRVLHLCVEVLNSIEFTD